MYLHIPNLYRPEAQDILLLKEIYCLEKIHGTSAHIQWIGGRVNYFHGGATFESFMSLFNTLTLTKLFISVIGTKPCVIFGEVYGGNLQGMRDVYGPDLKFVAFDVKIGDCWLDVSNAHDVVNKMGLEFVDYVKIPTDLKLIDEERDRESVQAIRNGMGPGKVREGVVLRSLIELTKNNGERLIAKHKGEAFSERVRTPKVRPDNIEVLTEAQSIADEWVVPMRLQHVLQKFPTPYTEKQIGDVIRAMVEDVEREAKGEIIESKEVRRAIGQKTVKLFKTAIMQQQ